jgi:hypothetical protein
LFPSGKRTPAGRPQSPIELGAIGTTVDQNDPAWKIAEAALKSIDSGPSTLDAALLQASAKDIARAYALCLSSLTPFSQTEATRLILDTRLQVALVQEHVAAQQRMGRTLNILTVALVVLTLALVIFGGIAIWQKPGVAPSGTLRALRAECGRDARAWEGAFVAEFRRTRPNWSSRMNSHYRERDQRCYAEVSLESDTEPGALFFDTVVFDVDDNRGIGELRQRIPMALGQQPEVLACTVGKKKCGTSDEWEALVNPYLDQ